MNKNQTNDESLSDHVSGDCGGAGECYYCMIEVLTILRDSHKDKARIYHVFGTRSQLDTLKLASHTENEKALTQAIQELT